MCLNEKKNKKITPDPIRRETLQQNDRFIYFSFYYLACVCVCTRGDHQTP